MTGRSGLPLERLGRVVGEPARLRVLQELLGGVPLPAGALAARLGIAASTTSGHLAQLHDAGLVTVERRGRTRLARLADPDVAEAVEALLRLSDEPPVTSLGGARRRTALREARSCYDHLAGRLGVALADVALERGWILDAGGAWTLAAEEPADVVRDSGLPLTWPTSARPAVRRCDDWTERRSHLAGRLGRALLDGMLDAGWVRRRSEGRALAVTDLGRERLTVLGVGGL